MKSQLTEEIMMISKIWQWILKFIRVKVPEPVHVVKPYEPTINGMLTMYLWMWEAVISIGRDNLNDNTEELWNYLCNKTCRYPYLLIKFNNWN